jgi:hypothetical protein
MEFLDPKYQRAHLIRLIIGYILVGTALILTTTILLYRARGYDIGSDGKVIQNGLVFVSSRPDGASIYIDGKRRAETTNARLLMASGQYTFELRQDGYRPWKRAIAVEGGSVMRYDYPALFPTKLTTSTVAQYDVQPPLTTQSPDRRWMLIQRPNDAAAFDMYDLRNPEEASKTVAVPQSLLTLRTGLQRWSVVEWANDNKHVLMQHTATVDGVATTEYLLFNRDVPAESVNLTTTLGATPTAIELRDKKFDKYYLYDAEAQTLSRATLDAPQPRVFLQKIVGFKSHGDDRVLYATTQGAAEGKAIIKLREGDTTYTIRQVAVSEQYMLDIASYDSAWYVIAGSPAENRTYVYKDPVATLRDDKKPPLVPVQVLKAPAASEVAFSDNARFIMVQGGQQIAVYDAENDRGYAYTLPSPIDSPQEHVTWMDGHRMMAVVAGKVRVFDFDNANSETLVNASPAFVPYFDRDYEFLYTVAPQTVKAEDGTESTRYVLTSTPLLTPEDQ